MTKGDNVETCNFCPFDEFDDEAIHLNQDLASRYYQERMERRARCLGSVMMGEVEECGPEHGNAVSDKLAVIPAQPIRLHPDLNPEVREHILAGRWPEAEEAEDKSVNQL